MSRPPFDVAVVGLGPTGAVLALALGNAGVRTAVFERDDTPYSQPRACHLDAETARILARHGLEHALPDLLTVSAGMEYVDRPRGRRLFTFEGFEREPILGWHEDYVFVQPQVELMLRRAIAANPSITVNWGVAPPVAELKSLATYVVGCDGASSSVRREAGITLSDLGYDEPWLVVDLEVTHEPTPPLPPIIQQVCDPRRLATFVPGHGTHRRWEFLLAVGEEPHPWDLLGEWGVTPAHGTLVRSVKYQFHALVAEQWRVGNVFVAGDAAHMMPPFMGQGLCSGVRDADNLAWKLIEVIRGRSSDDLLDTYGAERKAHTEAVVALSVEAGRTLRRLADDPLDLPAAAAPDPSRWSRLPGLPLGEFPLGHQAPQPDRLDRRLADWAWVAADPAFVAPDGRAVVIEPRATYGNRAVLVRPDRYIAAVVPQTR